MLFIQWLAKVTNDTIMQSAALDVVVGVSRYKDDRNRIPFVHEVSVEFNPGHRRHMDVSDHATRFVKMRGRKEFGCRKKCFDSIAQGPHEPFHGLTKELIILDDRDQWRFRHTASGSFGHAAFPGADKVMAPECEFRNLRQRVPPSNAAPYKLWLMSGDELRSLRGKILMSQYRCT
jgi:hypothetical protein